MWKILKTETNWEYLKLRCYPSSGPADSGPTIQARRFRPGRFRPVPIQASPVSGPDFPIQARPDSGPSRFRPCFPVSGPAFLIQAQTDSGQAVSGPYHFRPQPFHATLSHFRPWCPNSGPDRFRPGRFRPGPFQAVPFQAQQVLTDNYTALFMTFLSNVPNVPSPQDDWLG